MDDFINNTVDPSIFTIEDVANDNSCLYRALSNTLSLRTLDDIIIHFSDPENILSDPNYGFDGESQELFAKELQQKAYDWVINNMDNIYPVLGISIAEMIINCHEISPEEYIEYYKFFAGDIIVKNIKQNGKEINEILPNRWGSILELYAISVIYKIPICVYISQKYDIKKDKIIAGRIRNGKAEKNVRFRLSEIVGEEYLNDTPPLFILWRKTQCGPHYMALYPNKEIWLNEYKEIKEKN